MPQGTCSLSFVISLAAERLHALRAQRLKRGNQQALDESYPKWLVKSKEIAMVSVIVFVVLPFSSGIFIRLFKDISNKQLQLLGRLYCTGVLFGSFSLTAASVASYMLLI